MAFLKTELRNYLLTNSDLTDIIGTKVFPNWTSTITTRPYIIMQRVSQEQTYYMEGDSSLPFDGISLMVVSNTIDQAESISQILKSILSGLQKVTLDSSIYISSVFLRNISDALESPQDDSEDQRFIITHDYDFIYTDTSI